MGTQFSERIIACVRSALGWHGSDAEYMPRNFRRKTKIQSSEMAHSPEESVKCIYEIFGAGASSVESRIVEEICRSFDLKRSQEMGMVQAIELAKDKMFREELINDRYWTLGLLER